MDNLICGAGTEDLDPICGDEYWDDIEDECPEEEEVFDWDPEYDQDPNPYFYFC